MLEKGGGGGYQYCHPLEGREAEDDNIAILRGGAEDNSPWSTFALFFDLPYGNPSILLPEYLRDGTQEFIRRALPPVTLKKTGLS